MSNGYICRDHPTLRWWPRLELPSGRVLYNMVALGDDATEWFMLEFADELPRNSAAVRLASRRIAIPRDWDRDGNQSLAGYVRQKAAEWLNPGQQDSPWSFPPGRNPAEELVEEVRKLTRCVTDLLESRTGPGPRIAM